jgi:hypothetical protein
MARCLSEIMRRHESLRTTIKVINGQPVQVINPPRPLVLPIVDLSGLPEDAREDAAKRLAAEEAGRPFDLVRGPLLRTTFLRLGEADHVALFTMHHIGSDGWSLSILTKEVAVLYDAFSAGIESPLAELPMQYADYAYWQRNWLQGEVLEAHLSYWRQKLGGAPTMLQLPTMRPRSAVKTNRGRIQSYALSRHVTSKLKELCREEGVTMFMALLASFQTLLARFSGQDDIVICTGITNRTRREIEALIGFFINTLVLRTDLSGNPSFRELLKRVREVTLGAYAHQDLPFEKLVEELQPERSLTNAPFSQVMMILQNTPQKASGVSGLALASEERDSGDAKFDLYFTLKEGTDRIGAAMMYKTELFEDSTITCMMNAFEKLLEEVVENPDQKIQNIPLVTAEEYRQMIDEFND